MLSIRRNSRKLLNLISDNIQRNGFGCIDGGKHRISCIFIGVFVPLLLCVTSCKSTETPVSAPDESVEAAPTQKLGRFSTQHTEAGVLKWTLVGDTSTFHGSYVEVENPTVQIFENGVVSITLNGEKGKQFLSGRKKDSLHLTGNVVGVSKDGKLFTETLYWRNLAGKLYAPDEATVVRGDSTWLGTEMLANPTLETVTMKNNEFTLYPKDEKTHEHHNASIESE
ncbi:LPS export ABC transporter periplasmic protein LptC [Candidatus Poribacteria bacterium]|nr:MAG: LPS export ABC transporter periplasmic protein LptC [Candidatus Poribacteria bacterium]